MAAHPSTPAPKSLTDLADQRPPTPSTALKLLEQAIKADQVMDLTHWIETYGWTPRLNEKSKALGGLSPLGWAAAFGATACLPLLWSLAAGNVGAECLAWDATEKALTRGEHEAARLLMDACPRAERGLYDLSWLSAAAMGGSVACVDLALARDPAAARARSGRRGLTPLMASAASVNIDIMRKLLPLSDPMARDNGGRDALMFAAECCWAQGMRELLPVSDPRATDENGYTALMIAASAPSLACVSMLLPLSDEKAKTIDGLDALALIARRGARLDDAAQAEFAEVRAMVDASAEAKAIALSCAGGREATPGTRRI